MYWILAAIFLILAVAVPRVRIPAIICCVVMGLMLSWGMVQRLRGPSATDPPAPVRGLPSPAVATRAFPLDAVDLTELKMVGGGAPFDLRGRIANRSHDQRLISVTLQITRRDCFEGALDPSGCVTLFEDRRFIPVAIAPQEEREFAASFFAHGSAMRPRGTTKDEFVLVSAEGQTVR
ncbi:MAG TPA: hypothetical protein VGN07_05060 [Steroidobacteraceae bacterium]